MNRKHGKTPLSNTMQNYCRCQNGSGLVKQALRVIALTLFMLTEIVYLLKKGGKSQFGPRQKPKQILQKKTAQLICTCKHVFAHFECKIELMFGQYYADQRETTFLIIFSGSILDPEINTLFWASAVSPRKEIPSKKSGADY